jgi:hypothetical protein
MLRLFLEMVNEDHDHFENGFTCKTDFWETFFEIKSEEVQDPFNIVSVN